MLEQAKEFPYKSKRNILVFGTNSKWLKTLNQYVVDITYYEETSKSDYSAKLRNADVIWYHPKIKKQDTKEEIRSYDRISYI